MNTGLPAFHFYVALTLFTGGTLVRVAFSCCRTRRPGSDQMHDGVRALDSIATSESGRGVRVCVILDLIMLSVRLCRTFTLVFFVAGCPFVASSEVRLPHLLSSHMVLQRDAPAHIWGWSDPGERVTVTFHGVSRSGIGDRLGKWSVYLPPQPAGGPFPLTVAGTNTLVLDDVLVGDVWFASGQSNMEMPLRGFRGAPLTDSAEEVQHAAHDNIRLLHLRQSASSFPLRDNDASWTPCTPETAGGFSAAAYFFGRDLAQREHVPVGLIDSTWGGTVVEAWISLDAVSADASLMPAFATRARMMDSQADMKEILAAERREDDEATKAGMPAPSHTWHPDPSTWAPAALFNGMVAPATPMTIRGVIWYQGESNSRLDFAPMYERLFPTLIADWRRQWHEGDFPLVFVQIANFTSNATESWATIREAQRRTLVVDNTAMVVTIDIGNPDNVHPADKQTVGARLALAARALSYGEKVEYSGPLFRSVTVEGGALRLWFDHVSGGLVAKDGAMTGFEVAGEDRHFVKAEARIDGVNVVVSSLEVPAPRYARYGWANAPVASLFGSTGLPASPFTSEDEIPIP